MSLPKMKLDLHPRSVQSARLRGYHDAVPDLGQRRMEGVDGENQGALNDGVVARVIADLKPLRERNKTVAACMDCFKADGEQMRCDLCRKRGLPVGSGVSERAYEKIVVSRFTQSAFRCPKTGANTLFIVKCCIENNRWADFLD